MNSIVDFSIALLRSGIPSIVDAHEAALRTWLEGMFQELAQAKVEGREPESPAIALRRLGDIIPLSETDREMFEEHCKELAASYKQ